MKQIMLQVKLIAVTDTWQSHRIRDISADRHVEAFLCRHGSRRPWYMYVWRSVCVVVTPSPVRRTVHQSATQSPLSHYPPITTYNLSLLTTHELSFSQTKLISRMSSPMTSLVHQGQAIRPHLPLSSAQQIINILRPRSVSLIHTTSLANP